MVAYVEAHSLLGASQHFGLDRKTIREWRDRYRADGLSGLVPRYPGQRPSRLAPETIALLDHARRELEYGAARTRVWLRRVHQIHLPMATIQHAFRRMGGPALAAPREAAPATQAAAPVRTSGVLRRARAIENLPRWAG